jgi:hypothetical protein
MKPQTFDHLCRYVSAVLSIARSEGAVNGAALSRALIEAGLHDIQPREMKRLQTHLTRWLQLRDWHTRQSAEAIEIAGRFGVDHADASAVPQLLERLPGSEAKARAVLRELGAFERDAAAAAQKLDKVYTKFLKAVPGGLVRAEMDPEDDPVVWVYALRAKMIA